MSPPVRLPAKLDTQPGGVAQMMAIHPDSRSEQQLVCGHDQRQMRTLPGRYVERLVMIFQAFCRAIQRKFQALTAASEPERQILCPQPGRIHALLGRLKIQDPAKLRKGNLCLAIPAKRDRLQVWSAFIEFRCDEYAIAMPSDMAIRMRHTELRIG